MAEDTRDPGGWRSIESAPKDGTELLLGDSVRVEMGSWQDESPDVVESGVVYEVGYPAGWWGSEFFPGGPQPTHYMLVPPPPPSEDA